MWEAISTVFTGSSAGLVIASLFGMVVLLAVLAKIGIVSVHRKGVKIGGRNELSEQLILRKQIAWVQKYCLSLETQLAKIFEKKPFKDAGARAFYFKYLACLISNEAEQWVLANNMAQSQGYVSVKQMEMKALLMAQVGAGFEYSEANLARKTAIWTSEIVSHVLAIRKGNGAF